MAARAAIASTQRPQLKFIQSLAQAGFPLTQLDEVGKDPLAILMHKDVQKTIISESIDTFLKAGYIPSAVFVAFLLRANQCT